MKKVLVHWVEMVTLEVPDECPTDNSDDFERWLYDHDKSSLDIYKYGANFVTKADTRDFEIVEVENV